MITTETARKLNAVDTALSLLNEAGVKVNMLTIDGVSDEEVKQIATDRKVEFNEPSYMNPYLWCTISKGSTKVSVNGVRKRVEIIERVIE